MVRYVLTRPEVQKYFLYTTRYVKAAYLQKSKQNGVMESVKFYSELEDADDNVFHIDNTEGANFAVDGEVPTGGDILEDDSDEDIDADDASAPDNARTLVQKRVRKSDILPEGWCADSWTRDVTLLQRKENFTASPGCTFHIPPDADEYFFFKTFLTDLDIDVLTIETNRYASAFLNADKLPAHSSTVWQWPTDGISSENMWCFLALTYYMGLVKKDLIRDYWTVDSIFSTPFPPSVMSRNYFLNIFTFLHCHNTETYIPRGLAGHDPRQKLGDFYFSTTEKFREMYIPRERIAIDEGGIPFKGRVAFRCFNPRKPDKYHLKTFKVCDSKNGYCHTFQLFVGDEGLEVSPFGKTHDLVMTLMAPFANKGYSVYMDNFYTSPYLFYNLKKIGITATGTSKPRKGYPKALFDTKLRLKDKGASVVYTYNNEMLAMRVVDRKVVTFLTTEHNACLVNTGKLHRQTKEAIVKPDVMNEYNKFMGGVDLNDQLAKYSAFNRRSCKWWKKVFFRLLNLVMVNAYVLYRDWQKSMGKDVKNLRQVTFRQNIIKAIIAEKLNKTVCVRNSVAHLRLVESHYPNKLFSDSTLKNIQRHCVVCNPAEKRLGATSRRPGKTTTFHCPKCNVALCAVPCFELYHTYSDYEREYISRKISNTF